MERARAAISVGAFQQIYTLPPEQALPEIVVQCLQIKNLTTPAGASERYRLVFSDTQYYIQCMLASQANHFVKEGELKKGVLVRLKSYSANVIKDRRIIIVVDIEILTEYGEHEKIGDPENLEKALQSGQLALPVNTSTSSNAFYGNKPAVQAPKAAGPSNEQMAVARGGGGSGHAHICPIEALSPYQNRWTIKARVTHKSEIKTWKNQRGPGKLFTVHFLDETGEIRATGFNDQCDAFYEVLQEGQVYYISKCRVNMAKRQFSNVNNDYELTFERDTEVEKCPDQSDDVPQMRYSFVPLGDLNTVDKDAMVDVIGVIKEVGDCSETVSKTTNKPYMKREITLVDTSGYSTRLTVWGGVAQNWETPVDSIVAFKGVKVSDFGGRSLSMLMSSFANPNPDIDEAHKLKGWYDAQGRNETFANHQGLSGMGAAGGRKDPFKNLGQVIDEKLGMTETQDYYSTKATIVYIKQDNVYYPACLSDGCNKKVLEVDEGQWRCEKCDKVHPKPLYRYIMTISVNDAFNQAWFSCFDDVGRDIMGMSADDLAALEMDEKAKNAAYNEANGKTYIFKCRAKMDNYNGTERVRHAVVSVQPLNYATESAKLAEIIKLYSRD